MCPPVLERRLEIRVRNWEAPACDLAVIPCAPLRRDTSTSIFQVNRLSAYSYALVESSNPSHAVGGRLFLSPALGLHSAPHASSQANQSEGKRDSRARIRPAADARGLPVSYGLLAGAGLQGFGGGGSSSSVTPPPPPPLSISVTVTPQADATKKVQATVAVNAGASLPGSPSGVTGVSARMCWPWTLRAAQCSERRDRRRLASLASVCYALEEHQLRDANALRILDRSPKQTNGRGYIFWLGNFSGVTLPLRGRSHGLVSLSSQVLLEDNPLAGQFSC
jgi:hypothetical protein